MHIDILKFDQFRGHQVEKIRLTNDHNVSVGVLTMGAILNEFSVPQADGRKNLVLSFDQTKKYYDNPFYIGMAIGRTAGRIKDGTMPLAKGAVHLPPNENNNTHHGGPHGFFDYLWDYHLQKGEDFLSVTFTHQIKESDDGYPGNIAVAITFKLTNDDQVIITYQGTADQPTLFNPTCHAYFNLSNHDHVLNHQLTIASAQYLAVDQQKVPTGEFLATASTAYDFRQPVKLQDAIAALQSTPEKGLNDIFKINENAAPIAKLQDLDSKDALEIYSKRNGLVVYTANALDETLSFTRGPGRPQMGIAMEAQTLPDTHNHPGFGDITLSANEPQSYTITYRYLKGN